VNKDNQ